MLYLQTFTEAAIVCDCTVILETIPIVIFEKRHICQCWSYPFTDCWGLKHENRFKPFTSFWISIGSFWLVSYSQRCQWVFKSGWASSNVVGIICPLVVIGLTELPNSEGSPQIWAEEKALSFRKLLTPVISMILGISNFLIGMYQFLKLRIV